MPDQTLLVFRVLDRPPLGGEHYIADNGTEILLQARTGSLRRVRCRAVVPEPDFVAGAAGRIRALLTISVPVRDQPDTVTIAASAEEIRAAILGPEPEPEPEGWMRECALSFAQAVNASKPWAGRLARHIAKFAKGAGR